MLRDLLKDAFAASYHTLVSAAADVVGREDAEDVVQDAFVKLIERKAEFKGECKIETYLYSVVRKVAISFYRRKNAGIDKLTMSDSKLALEVAASKTDDGAMLPQYTEPLSVADRDLMSLRKLGKKWYLRAPEILGISPGNARVKFTRLSKKMREESEEAATA